METYIKDIVSARHKALAGPPIFLVEHNLSLRTNPAECEKIMFHNLFASYEAGSP